jgi:aldehyde dehydrogenase (NAD+)
MNRDEAQVLFQRIQAAAIRFRTEPIANRRSRLAALKNWIYKNRERIHQAAHADMGKPQVEFYGIEILYLLNEIDSALRNLKVWIRPRKVPATLEMMGSRSYVMYEPKGACLIIAPWNYPFSLCVGPMISALAAGNTVVLKPSEFTPAISRLIKEMAGDIFSDDEVAVVEGGIPESEMLLSLPFDHIFFTGSPEVGKVVMRAAANHLASVTLELGGKCPAIVTKEARLEDAALRIAVSKYSNAGQTCVAPDYVIVHKDIFDDFVKRLIANIQDRFHVQAGSPGYARIIHKKHFDRLADMQRQAEAGGAKTIYTGEHDREAGFYHPTVMTHVPPESRLMQEEIFGPILPVVSVDTVEEAIEMINRKPKPLALYAFSRNQPEQRKVLKSTSAGTACINDCAIQFLHHKLPFGGTNYSGLGKSHDFAGFVAFSNEKPVLRQMSWFSSVQMLYPPATGFKKKFMEWLLWRLK